MGVAPSSFQVFRQLKRSGNCCCNRRCKRIRGIIKNENYWLEQDLGEGNPVLDPASGLVFDPEIEDANGYPTNRTINPNSLKNLRPRAKEKGSGSIKKSVTLHPATVAIASKLNKKSLSNGIDKLFAQLSVFYRVKQYLETQTDDAAAALLIELESLEIDQVYEECIAEGVIVDANLERAIANLEQL